MGEIHTLRCPSLIPKATLIIVSDGCLRGNGRTETHMSSSVISRSWSHVSKPSLRRISWYCSRPRDSKALAKSTDRTIQTRDLPARLVQRVSAQRLRVKRDDVWEEERRKCDRCHE